VPEPQAQAAKRGQQGDRDEDQRPADDPNDREEDGDERQIDHDQPRLAGIELAQLVDRVEPVEVDAGRARLERADIGGQHAVDGAAAGRVLEAGGIPAGDIGPSRAEEPVDQEHADQADDQQRKGIDGPIGQDAVVDLQYDDRQGEREHVDRQAGQLNAVPQAGALGHVLAPARPVVMVSPGP